MLLCSLDMNVCNFYLKEYAGIFYNIFNNHCNII
jgi:hypothetical protein